MSAVILPEFDWANPDYRAINLERAERLARLRSLPQGLPALRAFYADNIPAFIDDWGFTSDPRGALLDPPQPVVLPFRLFPRQIELINFIIECSRNRQPGLIEKSRDIGASWLAMCTAVSLCLFNRNITIGFGSAKEDLLDRTGDPSCLFHKGRFFLERLPAELRGGWVAQKHSAHLRLAFPETQSSIVGEAGDQIGRGARTSIFFVDEAAHIPHGELIEASLAATTDCRIDISSVAGMANSFARRRHSGKIPVFRFHWKSDPRKSDAWYRKQQELLDPVTVASELDIDYHASTEHALIPTAWVLSAIGSAEKLGIQPSGVRIAALDVADTGADRNAFASRHGIELTHLESWSGKDRDIFDSVARSVMLCDEQGIRHLEYDATGIGAGVRGDLRVINEQRRKCDQVSILDNPFVSAGEVYDPEGEMVSGKKNRDHFANLKAQCWFSLRHRFQATHRAVAERKPIDPESIISINPDLPELNNLINELSQPTYRISGNGKVVIDKAPDGTMSPNLADAVMIAFNPASAAAALQIWITLAVD